MFKPVRLIPDNPGLNFLALRKAALIISAIMVVGSLVLLATRGLNFGIDFRGGILIEARFDAAPDVAALRPELEHLNLGQVSLQATGSDGHNILIRVQQQTDGDTGNQRAIQTVRDTLGKRVAEYLRIEMVGPQVGDELRSASLFAALLSVGGILVYIWLRFDRAFSVATVLALLHDIIITLGFFSLLHLEFDLSTVAAVLLISGYSLNDTVVVFDRIRENMRKFKTKPMVELSNFSLNETLFRTMMTSGTTLLVLVSLFLFGGEVIRNFTIALIFGIVIGTYSSIYMAAPAFLLFEKRK